MQALESYSWAMMGSFMIMLPFNWCLSVAAFKWFMDLVTKITPEYGGLLSMVTLGVVNAFYIYVGIWNVKTLRSEEVIAGFNEKEPEDM